MNFHTLISDIPMISIKLTGCDELVQKFDKMPQRVQAEVETEMNDLIDDLRNYVITNKLSGQVLRHITGNLWRSIQSLVQKLGSKITGIVYASSDCKYAAIHEYGGTIHMPARGGSVRLRVDARGNLLRQKTNDKLAVFAKASHKRAISRDFKSASYDIVMPERSYLRSSLRDNKDQIIQRLQGAVARGIK